MRKLLDGREVPELDMPVLLNIYTKCPSKWRLIDMETNEVYEPYDTVGKLQWKKIDTNWMPK
jgi:hypothetical protein